MNDQELAAKEIDEVKLDSRLMNFIKKGSEKRISWAARGRDIARIWIEDVETLHNKIRDYDKKKIIDYASGKFSKLVRRYGDEAIADKAMYQILNVKFSGLIL